MTLLPLCLPSPSVCARLLPALALAVVLTAISVPVAQAQQLGDTNNRLQRLEREIQTLSRQVYRGEAPAAGAVTPLPQDYATEFEVRLQGLERTMRGLTGEVERLRFDLNQLSGRFDRALADVEFRLEQGDGGDDMSTSSNNAAAATTRIVQPNTISNVPNTGTGVVDPTVRRLGVINTDGEGAGSLPADGSVGSLNGAITPGSNASQPLVDTQAGNTGGVVANTQSASATPVAVTLPEGNAQTQYDYAFGLLKQYQFEAAADALSQFLNNHPTDPLAANAQFWLGETHFVNGDYREAAVAFATGYEKFPTGEKGAENLLKLGMSLGRLGQEEEACLTLTRLADEYPQAPGSVKQQAIAEQRDLGCNAG
ncbi:MAG: tol-pal system protein YbgF [Pseudomonadota bacterium]